MKSIVSKSVFVLVLCLSAGGVLLSSLGYADHNENDRARLMGRIVQQLRDLENDVLRTPMTVDELLRISTALDEISENGGHGTVSFQDCFKFAEPKFNDGLTDSDAAKRASEACQAGMRSVEVMQFIFEKYDDGMTSVDAITKAFDKGSRFPPRKLELLKFIFKGYDDGMTSSDAMTRSLDRIAENPRIDFECLKVNFEVADRSSTGPDAMDSAIKSCAR